MLTFMSKGPGRISRAISAAFETEPDNAFTTTEVCERAYADCKEEWVEKKHRIAVVRAAKKIPRLDYFVSDTLGGQLVFFDPCNLMSYAMARLKADNLYTYRNNDPRRRWRQDTEADLRAILADDRHRQLLGEGGAWWQEVELARAKARGDHKRAAQLQIIIDARLKAYAKAVGSLVGSAAK